MEAWLPAHKKEEPPQPSLPLDRDLVPRYLRSLATVTLKEDGDVDLEALALVAQVCRAFAVGTSELPGFKAFWWVGEAREDAVALHHFLDSHGLYNPRLRIDGLDNLTVALLGFDGDFAFGPLLINALEQGFFADVAVYAMPQPLDDYLTRNPWRKRQLLRLSLMKSGLSGLIEKHGYAGRVTEHKKFLDSVAHQQGHHFKHVYIFGGSPEMCDCLDDPEGSPAALYAADTASAGLAAFVVKKSPLSLCDCQPQT